MRVAVSSNHGSALRTQPALPCIDFSPGVNAASILLQRYLVANLKVLSLKLMQLLGEEMKAAATDKQTSFRSGARFVALAFARSRAFGWPLHGNSRRVDNLPK
jgi:hypothetical protein